MKKLKEMNEQELRDTKVRWPETKEELIEYIDSLVDREHDYGTSVYAVSMSAVATFKYVASQLGITGFQASCADMDVLKRIRNLKSGFRILDYGKLLYPQYCNHEHFPSIEVLLRENGETLAKKAKDKLEESNGDVHPHVKAHWEKIITKYGEATDEE